MADLWSQLPEDLLDITTKRLDLDDLIRFSCVCQNWKSFSTPLLPPNHLPWLVVPHPSCTTIHNQTMGFFSFHNPSRIHKVDTPQTASRRIIGSCQGGWLITLHENGEIQLFHPFSKVVVNLPPLTQLPSVFGSVVTKRYGIVYTVSFKPMFGGPERRKRIPSSYMLTFYVWKTIMSSACPTTAVILIIHGYARKLAIFRPGKDHKWIALRGDKEGKFNDITRFQGNFFAVQDDGSVFVVCGLDTSSPFIQRVISETNSFECYMKYLVDFKGELLLLVRVRSTLIWPEMTERFEIKKRDSTMTKWVQADDIIDEESALFVGGINDSFVLSTLTAAPDCKGGCIYFTDDNLEKYSCYQDLPDNLEAETPSADWIGGQDLGVYNITTDTIERFYPNSSMCIEPMPFWFTPNSH